MLESFAVQVVLTVSSAGAGMGIGKQVSKSEKTCLCSQEAPRNLGLREDRLACLGVAPGPVVAQPLLH